MLYAQVCIKTKSCSTVLQYDEFIYIYIMATVPEVDLLGTFLWFL